MDKVLIASLIGGVCTIAAPVVTLFVKSKLENAKKPQARKDRIDALNGSWAGEAEQLVGIAGKAKIDMNLRVNNRDVTGNIKVDYEQDSSINVRGELIDGLFDGAILRITYRNAESTVLQHGNIHLELEPDGRTMTGGFIGYGYRSKKVVFGSILLSKNA